REGRRDAGELGADAVRNLVDDAVPGQEHVLREAAPEVVRLLARRIAVAARVRIRAPVGRLAVTVLTEAAPLAAVAGDVVLDEDPVALTEAVAVDELLARLRNRADVLVAHDHGVGDLRLVVHLHVGAADPGD